MGILAPLYLAGLAALSLPLILHLVRRTPKGRQAFSSLMFLSPSPPRLTRRSRLDQILLLLMRLAALALLAFAFARPFLRASTLLTASDLPQRRVAILVDTSASMRRADLWDQAAKAVEKELDDLAPHDEVALYTFSDRLETVIGFREPGDDASQVQADVVRQRLASLKPSWRGGDLGTSLVALAGELSAASDLDQTLGQPQIVLVSDFQAGNRIEALQAFEWPEEVRVVTRQVTPRETTNAYAHLLASDEETAEEEWRVRVVNAADSVADQFYVRWESDELSPTGQASSTAKSAMPIDEIAVYVPPGQSRVVKLPRAERHLRADRIVLRGDDHDFDNTHYVVPPQKQAVTILFAGPSAADDPQGMRYYLEIATAGDPLREVTIAPLADDAASQLASDSPPQLAVVTGAVSAEQTKELMAFAERGGTVLVAVADRMLGESLTVLAPGMSIAEEVEPQPQSEQESFLLFGEIDFRHPLFAPFAMPRYSDFTKIHFWRHTSLAISPELSAPESSAQVAARFDNGEPALVDVPVGKGRTLVLASGWSPDDSQLALSSKFVPLVGALVDLACDTGQGIGGVTVGQPVELPTEAAAPYVVHPPTGKPVQLAAGQNVFAQTDAPGIYRASAAKREISFAVNLPLAESNTAPVALEQLEQFGVRMGTELTTAERLDQQRQARDVELENRQKIWRWLLIAALGFVILETWWAGRASRQIDQQIEGAT
jgi:hypothetical protein